MNGPLVIGQYLPGDSLVHRLDPRVKMIILLSGRCCFSRTQCSGLHNSRSVPYPGSYIFPGAIYFITQGIKMALVILHYHVVCADFFPSRGNIIYLGPLIRQQGGAFASHDNVYDNICHDRGGHALGCNYLAI